MLATVALCCLQLVPTRAFGPTIQAEEGNAGVQVGYRYVPNLFFWESQKVGDPVTSAYYGSPAVELHFDYFPLATVPVMFDVAWGGERHELASEGWLETQSVAFALSVGYKLDLDFPFHPYAVAGLDLITTVVTDKIKMGEPVTGIRGTFGVHGAVGAYLPAIIPPAPWLSGLAELKYTYATVPQRGRSYQVIGVAATLGAAIRFDMSRMGNRL